MKTYCLFGQREVLARAFRHEQTRSAIIQETCQIKQTKNSWGMRDLSGARILEKISDSKNKQESRNYYLSKEFRAAEGQVDPKFL